MKINWLRSKWNVEYKKKCSTWSLKWTLPSIEQAEHAPIQGGLGVDVLVEWAVQRGSSPTAA